MTYYQELAQHIEKVKEILNKETWDKNALYFFVKDNILCMDVDGAIQIQVNPEIKKIYEQYINKEITAAAARRSSALAATASLRTAVAGVTATLHARHAAAASTKDFSDLFDLWINREDWIKEDIIYNNLNYGNLDLHYLVGLTGLDYNFEQKPETTLSMIKDKLDETIKLIRKIEKYIIYI